MLILWFSCPSFLEPKSKMTGDCWVFKSLRCSVDGKTWCVFRVKTSFTNFSGIVWRGALTGTRNWADKFQEWKTLILLIIHYNFRYPSVIRSLFDWCWLVNLFVGNVHTSLISRKPDFCCSINFIQVPLQWTHSGPSFGERCSTGPQYRVVMKMSQVLVLKCYKIMYTYLILLTFPVSYSFFFFIYFHGLAFCCIGQKALCVQWREKDRWWCIGQNSKKLVSIPRLQNNYAIQYSNVVRCNENNKTITLRQHRVSAILR